jgi:hypothetical protein
MQVVHRSSTDAPETPCAIGSSLGRPRFLRLGVGSASVDTREGDLRPVLQLGLFEGLSLLDEDLDETSRRGAQVGRGMCNALSPTLAATAKVFADTSENLGKESEGRS